MQRSHHFDGRRFFNPTGANGQPFKKVPELMREPGAPWPRHVPVAPRAPQPRDGAGIVVTFVGHSTFLIQTSAGNILTDPVYSRRASPVPFAGPARVRAPGVRFDDLPDISIVLLSHNHYDHCDLATLRQLERRFRPRLVTPLNNRRVVARAPVRQVEELDWWESARTLPMPVTVTPAQHFSARTPFDRNRSLWGGFVLDVDGVRLFFAGDTGYAPHFREIAERLAPIDLALLPIGAYEPRWFMKDVHMNPAEAVQAHVDLGATASIGMHFGTFQLTTEAIDAPLTALAAARREHGLPDDAFRTLEFGESLHVPPAR